jgi:hypothetical protein
MREEFENFLKAVNKGTTLDELAQHCQTDEELQLALNKAGEMPYVSGELSDAWKEKAMLAFKNVAISDIHTKAVQIKLNVGYHLAIQIKEWLLKESRQTDIDVFDLNNTIAQFIGNGLRKYIVANKQALFPTCGKDELPDRVQLFQSEEKMKT